MIQTMRILASSWTLGWVPFLFLWLTPQSHLAQNHFPPLVGSAWEQLPPSSLGFCPERIDSLYAWLESVNTRSFILLQDGRIVLERYFGSAHQEAFWYWASAGKSLTAFMVGQAQEEGLLSIHQPVAAYLGPGWSSCPPDKEALIEVRHLLSMSSGLDDALPPTPAIPEPDNCTLPPCLVYKVDAGTRWAYHNAPYRLSHHVLEAASDQTLIQFTRSRVFDRTGMKGFWLDQVMYGRARDMARFGLLCLARGVWNGDTLLADQAYFQDMITPSQTFNRAYGYLWWLNGQPSFMAPDLPWVFPGKLYPQAPDDLYAALGRDDQIIHVVPSKGWVVVRQGGKAADTPMQFGRQLWDRLNALVCQPADAAEPVRDALVSALSPNPTTMGWLLETQIPLQGIEVWSADARLGLRLGAQPAGMVHIPASDLPPGHYLIKLVADQGIVWRRAIKVQR